MFSKPSSTACCSHPWQVLVLVARHLDPKTLAIASSVSKSWSTTMSSDHLWKPIFSTHFPSLSALLHFTTSAVPYRRLYALGHISTKRRLQKPLKPYLSLDSLVFTVDVQNKEGSRIYAALKPGEELNADPAGVFRFDIDVDDEIIVAVDELGGLKVTWNVVLEGFEGVFTMMDCEGRGSFVAGADGWFSEELPSLRCCSGAAMAGGLVADLRLGLRGESNCGGGGGGKVRVEKVSVGVLSVVSWRFVTIDDGLHYLQHFLTPSVM